jgi:hypothetical protein
MERASFTVHSPAGPIMRFTGCLAVLCATLLAADAAAAQNGARAALPAPPTDRDVVVSQLDAAARVKQTEGFSTVRAFDARDMVGMLPQHGMVVMEVQLRAGREYFVTGSCDADCDDLDLRAFVPDGTEMLAEDVETDDVPILSFTARETGPHLLGVVMSSCRASLCYFGVRVMSR